MPNGYWIPQIDISDPEGYKAYMAATPPVHEKFHGVALVRGGRMEVVEGRARSRCVLREFPDFVTALACYRSDEYQRARPLRLSHSTCDFVIVEGYDGPQPPAPSPTPAGSKKGYWIGQIDVRDPQAYKAYMATDQAAFGQFGARYLVRGGCQEITEGKARARIVVLEFPSFAAALACYRSGEYQAAKKLRDGLAEADIVVVEGYDGARF
jgi:uncharacterized protein (DUF1330 family)